VYRKNKGTWKAVKTELTNADEINNGSMNKRIVSLGDPSLM